MTIRRRFKALPVIPLVLTRLQLMAFWGKVDIRDPDECWPWIGSVAQGYGHFRLNDKVVKATHVSLWLAGRARPSPQHEACHSDTCQSGLCVNERHLRWGTRKENMADRDRLGRLIVPGEKGTERYNSVLTDDDVRYIRRAAETQAVLAEKYGVTQSLISCVKSRKKWAHVKDESE